MLSSVFYLNKIMKRINQIFTTAALLTVALSLNIMAQNSGSPKQTPSPKPAISATDATPSELAKSALAAHGGDKLKQMKSLVMRGSVDINMSNQNVPATFSIAISGDKYLFEINNPFQPLKQIFDGSTTYSSLQGFSLPPITSLGFPLLVKTGDAGYVISAASDAKKKTKGFRITTPEGYYTDFYLDDKSKQIKSYESSYDVGGRMVTTSVEIDETQTVEGVIVPKKYSQRFDLGSQMTVYASFKSKEILVNAPIDDSVFAIPR